MTEIGDETFDSISEMMASLILDRIHGRDENLGGVFSMASGMPGVGKTGVDLSFAEDTILNYPNEKIFMRNTYNVPLQFLKLPKYRWHIMRQSESKVSFHDLNNGGEEIDLSYTSFTNYDDLYEKAKYGKINAVFFQQTGFWRDFVHWQLDGTNEWVTNVLDEIGELAPAFAKGEEWSEIKKFSYTLRDIRKSKVNVHSNTQNLSDVDYKINPKIIIRIYLFGARATKGGRVTQKAIDCLKLDPEHGNEAFMELGGSVWGKTKFKKIYKPKINMNWSARRTGKYKTR